MPGLPVHHQLLESTQTHVHWVGDAIQPSHPLSSSFPPALNLSQHQGLFKWVSSVHQVAKILEFQLQCQSFQWTPRTDLFRMDWLDLLAIQGTLKSLLQHHSSKASILQTSAFFVAQLSHPYMTTGKTIALTGWTFVGKTNWFIWKDPDAGKDWGQEEKGTKEDEMVGWRHRLNQWAWAWVNSGSWWWTEGLVCYSPCPLSQMWLGDWTELNWKKTFTEWLSYK